MISVECEVADLTPGNHVCRISRNEAYVHDIAREVFRWGRTLEAIRRRQSA